MKIGVLKEIKPDENRVSLLPVGAELLKRRGHTILVEKDAGENSGFPDSDYALSGADIVADRSRIFEEAELILKVKEPLEEEYTKLRAGQMLFTYYHLAANEKLTRGMINSGAIAIAYETTQLENGQLPLLTPMSEVAGRMAIQQGAKYLEREHGGRGVLLGGVPGVEPATVLVLGGGVVGSNAARMAAGLGAQVYILDVNLDRLRYLSDVMPANVVTLMSNPANVRALSQKADVIIGGVLIPGGRAPKLITREMLASMKKGAVMVDIAIDQGGSFETSRPTTHEDPIYEIDGVIHYCVTNMPGAMPVTSTIALTNATLRYIEQLADKGWKRAARENSALAKGLNIVNGLVTHNAVAEAFDLTYTETVELIHE